MYKTELRIVGGLPPQTSTICAIPKIILEARLGKLQFLRHIGSNEKLKTVSIINKMGFYSVQLEFCLTALDLGLYSKVLFS